MGLIFLSGQTVKFRSWGHKDDHWFFARYIKRLDSRYSLVEDHVGIRYVSTARLKVEVGAWEPPRKIA